MSTKVDTFYLYRRQSCPCTDLYQIVFRSFFFIAAKHGCSMGIETSTHLFSEKRPDRNHSTEANKMCPLSFKGTETMHIIIKQQTSKKN